jgi:hypothetical protein
LPMNLWSFSNIARVSSSLRGRILTSSSWGYDDSIKKDVDFLYMHVVYFSERLWKMNARHLSLNMH